jgi:hypothetical protein
MPDAKTMGRWGVALGPEVIKQVHERLVKIAQGNGLTQGRKLRVDTTWSGTVRLWDVATGRQIGPAMTHDGSVGGALLPGRNPHPVVVR